MCGWVGGEARWSNTSKNVEGMPSRTIFEDVPGNQLR